MKEFPKWMHRVVDGKPESKVFDKESDVPENEGWAPDPTDEHKEAAAKLADDGTGVSASQRVAAMDVQDAEARKRTADHIDHPRTSSPATPAPDPLDHTDGHRGIEFVDAGGFKQVVADVDTMDRDRAINTLQAMGVKYDGRWNLDKLQSELRSALTKGTTNAQLTQIGSSLPVTKI